jgi:hypothetical protein
LPEPEVDHHSDNNTNEDERQDPTRFEQEPIHGGQARRGELRPGNRGAATSICSGRRQNVASELVPKVSLRELSH